MHKQWIEYAWDAWCIGSVIGIWPRFIEPLLLRISRHKIGIPNLPTELEGLTILHFSDLHWSKQFPRLVQKKLIHKINALKPDFIVFTGDFLSKSKLEDPEGLILTLNSLKANVGHFAVLGNHDYAQFVTMNEKGDYDVDTSKETSNIGKGFSRLFCSVKLTKNITSEARQVKKHSHLESLLNQTPFLLLNNMTKIVPYKGSCINICGLEEYTLGKFNPEKAFKDYDSLYPGIVLSHNPDTLPILKEFPGDLILSGHTHGGQVNLPWIWKRFTRIENDAFKSGLKKVGKKYAYVNCGIWSVLKFRWFAIPELTFITLKGQK